MKQYCPKCGKIIKTGEAKYPSKYLNKYRHGLICQKCSEKESGLIITVKQYLDSILENKLMPNIKITAEVDGKQVPLETISTETFEAIKALEKPKEIPVARIGHYKDNPNDRRLFLKITDSIRNNVAINEIDMVAINLRSGFVNNTWIKNDSRCLSDLYENIKPL